MIKTVSHLFFIFIGCGIGGLIRFWITQIAFWLFGRSFPWGTLIVNVVGSFMIGFLYILLFEQTGHSGQLLRGLLIVGFLGGLTTFSSFSLETINLIESGKILAGTYNILLSVFLCLSATLLGIIFGEKIL